MWHPGAAPRPYRWRRDHRRRRGTCGSDGRPSSDPQRAAKAPACESSSWSACILMRRPRASVDVFRRAGVFELERDRLDIDVSSVRQLLVGDLREQRLGDLADPFALRLVRRARVRSEARGHHRLRHRIGQGSSEPQLAELVLDGQAVARLRLEGRRALRQHLPGESCPRTQAPHRPWPRGGVAATGRSLPPPCGASRT